MSKHKPTDETTKKHPTSAEPTSEASKGTATGRESQEPTDDQGEASGGGTLKANMMPGR